MDPLSVLGFAHRFGPLPKRTLIVGCEPQTVLDPDGEELLDELSAPVAAAVGRAVTVIEDLLAELSAPVKDNQGATR